MPPVVVGAAITFRPIVTNLVAIGDAKELGRVRRQTFVLPPTPVIVLSAVINYGPGTRLAAPLSPVDLRRKRPTYKLNPPTVVAELVVEVARPILTHLSYSSRRIGKYNLASPVVIEGASYFLGPRVRLAEPESNSDIKRRKPNSFRIQPLVVFPALKASGILFTKLAVHARNETRPRRKATSTWIGPYVVLPRVESWGYLAVNLAPSRRPITKARLRPPVVVGSATVEIYYGPKTKFAVALPIRRARSFPIYPIRVAKPIPAFGYLMTYLAPSRRGIPKSRFIYPAIIEIPSMYGGIGINLASVSRQSIRPVVNSRLRPPIAIVSVVVAYYGPKIKLASLGQRGRSRSFPVVPIIVTPNYGAFGWLTVVLAQQRRPIVKSVLRPPTVLTIPVVQVYYGPKTKFAPQRRGRPISELRTPVVIGGARIFRPVATKLVASPKQSRAPHSILKKPTLVNSAIIFDGPTIKLSPSTRGKPKSRLLPPAIIGRPIVTAAVKIKLAPSRRGIPKSELRPPAVIRAAVVFRPIETAIASQKPIEVRTRRASDYRLRGPIVVNGAVIFRPVKTKLVSSSRQARAPHSKLRTPAVISGAFIARPIEVSFAPSHRLSRVVHPELRPPARIGAAIVYAPIETRLAPSSRLGRATDFVLRTPAIVGAAFFARPVSISLAPSRFIKGNSDLRTPVVVGAQFFARPIIVNLAPSTRGKPQSRLFVPTIVESIVIFRPIAVKLAPSSRGITRSKLVAPVVVGGAFIVAPIFVKLAKQNLVQDRLTRVARFKLLPPAVVFTGSSKGYHSRTKINDRESSLVIVLNKPQRSINTLESNITITKRGTSRDRINDRESDLDIS